MDGNATTNPQLELTLPAAEGSLPDERWAGKTLGKYQLVRRLGKGGMGEVYEAVDPLLQRSVAVKVLPQGIASQPEYVRKFMREARVAARMNHPNIVHLYEADQEKDAFYIVMELMDGGSAHDRLHKWGPFGWVEATQVILDACRGLAAVHTMGLIHRDIKPSNIMRASDGTVKLADFGLALSTENPGERAAKSEVVGTPLYMSPEQCKGQKLDARSDVYSLGATFYTLLTGMPPFNGDSTLDIMHGHLSAAIPDPRSIAPNVPQACFDAIRGMMAKNAADRPNNAAAIIPQLEHALTSVSRPDIPHLAWAPTGPPTTTETPIAPQTPPTQPIPARTRVWFVAALLVLIGAAYFFGRYGNRPAPPPGTLPEAPDGSTLPPGETPVVAPRNEFDAGGPVTTLVFKPDDSGSLSWGTANGRTAVVMLATQTKSESEPASRFDKPSPIQQVAYTPDGKSWVSLFNGRLHFRDTATNREKFDDSVGVVQAGDIYAFAFHPTKPLVALAVQNDGKKSGQLVLRWLEEKPREFAVPLGNDPLKSLAFSTDGGLLVGGRDNGLHYCWNVDFRKRTDRNEDATITGASHKVGNGPVVAAIAMKLDPDIFGVALGSAAAICINKDLGKDLFAIASGRDVYQFNARRGTQTTTLYSVKHDIAAVALTPKSNRLICAAGSTVTVVDFAAGEPYQTFPSSAGDITALAVSADGSLVAVGTNAGKVFIWAMK